MTREALIRSNFDRMMHLIEIGPSHSPIIAKADGWQTVVVDHASQLDLLEKYRAMGVATPDRIEPVDFIWQGGPLTELIPPALHGTFDGLVASHVGEHFPDLIAFFKDASALIKSDGLMALALPDKRVCFDFFQPTTMTGDVVDAHLQGRTRHCRRTFFNRAAYFTTRDAEGGWPHAGRSAPFHLPNSIFDAQQAYDRASEDPSLPYQDTHAWTFTPKSFELLILELNLLGHIDWSIRSIESASGVEFYIWLERKRLVMSDAEVNSARLSLLAAMVYETRDAIAQLDEAESKPITTGVDASAAIPKAGASWPRPRPTIAVVVPLFNGSRFVEEALVSAFRQSLPATEIIVVNDGSTDNGAGVAIVERMAKTYPIKLLHKNNGGQSSARNFGVSHSTSELIAFLDQDDVWYDNHLQELVKPFQTSSERQLGWVYSNLDEIDHGGSIVCHDFLNTRLAKHPKRNVQDCIGGDMFVLPSATLMSKKAFEAIGGFDEELCGYEDDDLFLRMFRAGYQNIYLDMPLSKWRIYSDSTSYSPRMARSRAIYTRKLIQQFPDDAKRGCYYARDVIAPRFGEHAVREYLDAVTQDNRAAIEATWAEIQFLAGFDKSMLGRLFGQTLTVYRNALIAGDNATISAAWSHMAEAAKELPGRRLRVRATVRLLRNLRVSKSMFALRRIGRPAMVWAFSG